MRWPNSYVDEFIREVIGIKGLPVIKILKKRHIVSETEIATTTKKDINETRNLLYQLHHMNLVKFSKKRDGKKGWYNYYWSFNKKHIQPLITLYKKDSLDILEKRLEREKSNNFFICSNKCVRFDFSNAMDVAFKCPECGSLLNGEDNGGHIRKIEEDMKKLSTQIKKIEA